MKQNIIPKNNKKQPHGLWIFYYPNGGKLWYKGHWVNYIEYGYWIKNTIRIHPHVKFYVK